MFSFGRAVVIFIALKINLGMSDKPSIWPNKTVYYQFNEDLSQISKDAFLRTSEIVSIDTCVNFKQRNNGQREQRNEQREMNNVTKISYITIYGDMGGDKGCRYAHKLAVIGVDCHKNDGKVLSVIAKAVGLRSESNRYDRDHYVDLIKENIIESYDGRFIAQFKKRSDNYHYNLSYDYTSLLHSNFDQWAKTDTIRLTMVTKDIRYQYLIGKFGRLSFNDVKKLNFMYNCSDHCTDKNSLFCGNDGGYVGKNCACVCPDGISGQHCEDGQVTVPYTTSCTKTITMPGTIETPSNRTLHKFCSWDIQAPSDKTKVQVTFTEFKLMEKQTDNLCRFEFLELRIDESSNQGSFYCDEELNGKNITSLGRNMKILMNPYDRDSLLPPDHYIEITKGFKAIITFI